MDETLDAAMQALTQYFAPQKSTEFEVYKFRQAKQESHENLDSFHTRLRKLGEHCDFANIDKEVKSQIIQGCTKAQGAQVRNIFRRNNQSTISRTVRQKRKRDKQISNGINNSNTYAIRQKQKPKHRQQRQFNNTHRQLKQTLQKLWEGLSPHKWSMSRWRQNM